MERQISPIWTGRQGKTIQTVVKSGLCNMCGVCAGVCPSYSIDLSIDVTKGLIVPNVDPDTCNQCGICRNVCPGYAVDFEQLNQAFLPNGTNSLYVGKHINCYVGYATDESVRNTGASGGLVSAFLTFAIEQDMVSHALVTRMRQAHPLETEPFIARTKGDVLSAAGSRYTPATVGAGLGSALGEPGKFAVVGLPCHVHGIRKAQLLNSELRERALLVGLFCGHGNGFAMTEHVLAKLGIDKADVKQLDYRVKGWPGFMRIELASGEVCLVPYLEWFRREFSPTRCTLCSDGTAELADISCGDAWLPEYKGESQGVSIVITRTVEGEALVQRSIVEGIVKLEVVAIEKAYESQRAMLHRKKSQVKAHMALLRLLGRATPEYSQQLLQPSFGDYIAAIITWGLIVGARTPFLLKGLTLLRSLRRRNQF